MTTSRAKGFNDGVFAIAATLLVFGRYHPGRPQRPGTRPWPSAASTWNGQRRQAR
jgi:uncharacterized membrane protein